VSKSYSLFFFGFSFTWQPLHAVSANLPFHSRPLRCLGRLSGHDLSAAAPTPFWISPFWFWGFPVEGTGTSSGNTSRLGPTWVKASTEWHPCIWIWQVSAGSHLPEAEKLVSGGIPRAHNLQQHVLIKCDEGEIQKTSVHKYGPFHLLNYPSHLL
jgi:hypothetical protein